MVREKFPDKGGYFKYCGQEFWELISGDSEFYNRIIGPLGHNAKQRNRTFDDQYGAVVNRLCQEFSASFFTDDASIDWPKLVALSSAKGFSRREYVAAVAEATYEILKEKNTPVSRNDLLQRLQERGFQFGGKNPVDALVRMIRQDPRFSPNPPMDGARTVEGG